MYPPSVRKRGRYDLVILNEEETITLVDNDSFDARQVSIGFELKVDWNARTNTVIRQINNDVPAFTDEDGKMPSDSGVLFNINVAKRGECNSATPDADRASLRTVARVKDAAEAIKGTSGYLCLLQLGNVVTVPETIVAYLLLGTDLGREKEIADALQTIQGVTEVHVVYGEFDVLTHLECSDLKALDASITRARKVDGVIRTMTLIAG